MKVLERAASVAAPNGWANALSEEQYALVFEIATDVAATGRNSPK